MDMNQKPRSTNEVKLAMYLATVPQAKFEWVKIGSRMTYRIAKCFKEIQLSLDVFKVSQSAWSGKGNNKRMAS